MNNSPQLPRLLKNIHTISIFFLTLFSASCVECTECKFSSYCMRCEFEDPSITPTVFCPANREDREELFAAFEEVAIISASLAGTTVECIRYEDREDCSLNEEETELFIEQAEYDATFLLGIDVECTTR